MKRSLVARVVHSLLCWGPSRTNHQAPPFRPLPMPRGFYGWQPMPFGPPLDCSGPAPLKFPAIDPSLLPAPKETAA